MGRSRWLLAGVLALACAAAASAAPPPPRAVSWLMVSGDGDILAARAPDRRLPMASTTKIMTAIVALERSRLDERLFVPRAATTIGGSSAELIPGERVAVRDLVTALLVGSGNDAAIVLSRGLADDQGAFVRLMNARARELGLAGTRFANPHGLDAPGHYSTARDLVALGRAAMRQPRIREVVARRTATIPGPFGNGVRSLESENLLLSLSRDVDGIKTGHTDGAGYSLVTHARRPGTGVEIYLAMIGSPDPVYRAVDAKRMLDWGFRQYARPTIVAAGVPVARSRVRDRPGVWLASGVAEPVVVPIRLGRPITATAVVPPVLLGPVGVGERVGSLVIRSGRTVVAERPLVALSAVEGPSVGDRIRSVVDR